MVYSEFCMDASDLQNEPEVNWELRGGGVGLKNYTVVFIYKLGWFVCLVVLEWVFLKYVHFLWG